MRSVQAVVGSLAVVAALAACNGASGPARSSGSLAVSNDSKYLYAADSDNGLLLVLDSASLDKVSEVKVGARPFRLAVGKDDAIYVANRGSRSVSIVSHGDWAVVGELATGVDPVGMQLSSDGKTLYVVSATASDNSEYGILQSIDTATRKENWNLPIGDEPRGLALVNDDRALVSLYKAGEVVNVDLKDARVLNANVDFYTGVNQSALTATTAQDTRFTTPVKFHPRAFTDLAVTPDGTRVFGTTSLSREAPILTNPTPATAYYQSQGPRLIGSVTTSAVITFDTTSVDVNPLVEDVTNNGYGYYPGYNYGGTPTQTDYPQTSLAVSGNPVYTASGTAETSTILQGPSVAVVDMTGQWLFVVMRDSSNVAILPTNRRQAKLASTENNSNNPYGQYYAQVAELPSVYSTTSIGSGADGIAILGDNKTAYVYNQFDHTVQRLELSSNDQLQVKQTTAPLATELLTPDQVAGRKLFHNATDRDISSATASVACASCHLEGRDDGHTWLFPDGPRQTPTLAGRGMKDTAPYHWSGEFPTLGAFLEHTIISRMGGKGLSATKQGSMNSFVDVMPAPENPYKIGELTESQARGATVFQRAQCSTCHSGQWLTNKTTANVGTLVLDPSALNPDTVSPAKGLDVPSLRGLARSAPYLHSGSARTLRERLMSNPNDSHGVTSNLSPQDMDDLVSFLRTL